MGMDVYGKEPTSEVGEYFRRNVWGWHPLWDYVQALHGNLAKHVKHGHDNSGDGLKSNNSKKLAVELRTDLISGRAAKYVKERNERLASLPKVACELCDGTGIRTDGVGVGDEQHTRELSEEMKKITGRTHGWCNGCDGEGKRDDWQLNYRLDEQDIKEFADFLADCGGFEIR